jgi:hypothetical protein
MVSLQTIRANNASLKTLGPELVAVFGTFFLLSPYVCLVSAPGIL